MKMHLAKPAAITLLGIILTSGCTWVDPIAGASTVTLVKASHVVNCRQLGSTTSQVKNKVGFVNRSDDKVTGELLTLAQNSAVELGGDTVVAEGGPSEGTQKFKIYKCQ
tara:strand:+ start:7337 stop:7663 length:327 start_codon:yes stop_codon:yes gene_type:complete